MAILLDEYHQGAFRAILSLARSAIENGELQRADDLLYDLEVLFCARALEGEDKIASS